MDKIPQTHKKILENLGHELLHLQNWVAKDEDILLEYVPSAYLDHLQISIDAIWTVLGAWSNSDAS